MMRILHVTPSYLPAVRYGGPVFAVHGLCKALAAAGHDVDVFTTSVDGADDMPVAIDVCTPMDGVGVHYFPVLTPRRWYRSPALARALAERVGGYDIVHVHALFLHPVSAAAGIAWRAGVPYVLSPRGMLVRELFARRSPLVKRCWLGLIGRRALERAQAIHVTSAGEARDVARFGLSLPRLLEVPNGVDAPTRSAVPRGSDDVLFVGRLSWKKGIDRLIDAMALLPGRRLVIAGNDDEGIGARLRAQARALGIGDRVVFAGPVDRAQRERLLAEAAVFVLASLSENFANTVLEAMAAGCPVVVTPEVGLADAVRESGCGVVCDAAPRALAQAIDAVLADPSRAAAMGEAGRRAVDAHFLWPRVAARMAQGYESLLQRRERAA